VVRSPLSVEGDSKFEIQDSRLIIQTSHFRLYTSDFTLETLHFRLHTSEFTLQNSLPPGLPEQVDEHRRARHGGYGADLEFRRRHSGSSECI